jgi:hypothetical protein
MKDVCEDGGNWHFGFHRKRTVPVHLSLKNFFKLWLAPGLTLLGGFRGRMIVMCTSDYVILGRDERIFPLASVSRPALGPTQPPVQWVSGVLSRDKARPERDADHSSPSSAEVKNE